MTTTTTNTRTLRRLAPLAIAGTLTAMTAAADARPAPTRWPVVYSGEVTRVITKREHNLSTDYIREFTETITGTLHVRLADTLARGNTRQAAWDVTPKTRLTYTLTGTTERFGTSYERCQESATGPVGSGRAGLVMDIRVSSRRLEYATDFANIKRLPYRSECWETDSNGETRHFIRTERWEADNLPVFKKRLRTNRPPKTLTGKIVYDLTRQYDGPFGRMDEVGTATTTWNLRAGGGTRTRVSRPGPRKPRPSSARVTSARSG